VTAANVTAATNVTTAATNLTTKLRLRGGGKSGCR
jgi:hypothetical protein